MPPWPPGRSAEGCDKGLAKTLGMQGEDRLLWQALNSLQPVKPRREAVPHCPGPGGACAAPCQSTFPSFQPAQAPAATLAQRLRNGAGSDTPQAAQKSSSSTSSSPVLGAGRDVRCPWEAGTSNGCRPLAVGAQPPAPARRARRGRQCRPRVLTDCKHSLSSQVIVVWVGTNNHDNTAEEVAGGIEAIVRLINSQQPQAKVIVLVRAKDGAPARPVSSAPGGAGGHRGGQRCLSPLRSAGLPAVVLSPFPAAAPLSLLAMV